MATASTLVMASSASEIVGTINALLPQLPPGLRKLLNDLKFDMLMRYGVDGVFDRMNNKTVEAIIYEYANDCKLQPVDIGVSDEIKFAVWTPPAPESEPMTGRE